MSRLYDTLEPSVIDEDMLQRAVEEQGPKDEAGRIAKREGIDFSEVAALRLDFKNILKIDNLWCFTNIVKLQLDNNIIEKIEGLEELVNLVWLDLSFNNIEVIEGLDNLTQLEDLTLYNNRITQIENMENLMKLHVFSIGNNNIENLEHILYLRKFTSLQTLNLNGNPICEDESYKSYVISRLPNLDYLDYRLVDEATKAAAKEQYSYQIGSIEEKEKTDRLRAEADKEAAEQYSLHRSAYIENLNGGQLFDALYEEDTEGQKLNSMPGVDELIIVYKERFSVISKQIFDLGLERHQERTGEVDTFWDSVLEAKNENKKTGTDKILEFMEYKTQLFEEFLSISDQKVIELKITEYTNKVADLWDILMGLEMQLVDQLEEVIKDFERNMADMVGIFIEQIQGQFSQCRDLENMHHEKLLEIAVVTLEKVVKNEMDDDIPDDLRELMVDKDTIIGAVTASHDVHLLKIDNREDEIITRINQWMSNVMEEMHTKEEIQRNRERVTEVNSLIDHLRDELDLLDLQSGAY